METAMPASIDMPLGRAADHATNAPMAFRRERYWVLSFVMAPFKDIDGRAVPDPTPRRPDRRRGR